MDAAAYWNRTILKSSIAGETKKQDQNTSRQEAYGGAGTGVDAGLGGGCGAL